MPLKWSALKKAKQNRVTTITAITLIGIPLIISVTESLGIPLNLPVNICAGYLSALLFVVGIGVYSLGVPATISEYTDIHDYISKRKPELLIAFPDKKANIVIAHLDETQAGIKSEIEALDAAIRTSDPAEKGKLTADLQKLIEPFYDGCVVRYLQKEWHRADTGKNRFALIIGWLLIIGGIALAIYILIHNARTVFTHKTML